MGEVNLKNEARNLMVNFDKIDFYNVYSVLEWFYQVIDFNSMFEDNAISNYIYQRLVEKGYRELEDPKSELKAFNELLGKKDNVDSGLIGRSLISQIMTFIKKGQSLDMSLICLIQIFNERFNKELATTSMMNSLKQNIGTEVVYVGFRNGTQFLKTGTLDNVEDFKSITIDGERIPFIGFNIAIVKIQSVGGKELYNNSLIKDGYNIQDFTMIEKLNNETFGDEYQKAVKKIY